MWANSVWGLFGLGVTFAMARLGMIWTSGHDWIGPWLTRASVICFALSVIVLFYPFLKNLLGIQRGLGPDMPIHQAIDYIVNDSRADLRDQPVGYDDDLVSKLNWRGEQHNDALERVRQKLILGELTAWGRIQIGEPSAMRFDDALQEIPYAYWQSANFSSLFCFHASDSPQTFWVDADRNGRTYKSVSLSELQIVKFWPKKSLFRRLVSKVTRQARLTYWQKYDVH
jgi:hypothetical protein